MTELLRWRGPVRCAALAVRQLMRPHIDWYIFHIHETTLDSVPLTGTIDTSISVKIHNLDSGIDRVEKDLRAIFEVRQVDVAARLRAGDSVAIAYCGDVALGCSWFTSRNLGFVWGLAWTLRPREVVCFGSYVRPEWRGKRIHQRLNQAISSHLHERGIARTYGSMSLLNPQALSLERRTNKRRLMTLILVHVRALDWDFRYSLGQPLESRFHIQIAADTHQVKHPAF
jgi:hypothetical protein